MYHPTIVQARGSYVPIPAAPPGAPVSIESVKMALPNPPVFAYGNVSLGGDDVTLTVPMWYRVLATVSAGASAYHGYRRNDSVGWAIAWGLLGGLFPVITPAIALAQGFGQPTYRTVRVR